MKRTIAITMMTIAAAGSLMASGAVEETTYTKTEREYRVYISAGAVEVTPSGDVLGIFADNDNDGLYDMAEPFLTGRADRHDMPNDVNAFIGETISGNPDDLMETIYDDLKEGLRDGDFESSYMILGNYRINATQISTEGQPVNITYTREVLDFAPIGSVSVKPSSDILSVFSGNDDDGLYDETLPHLTSEAPRNSLSKDSADFIYSIISEDTDDIMDSIRDELKAPLKSGKVEKSEMVLGNYRITATLEAPKVYKFRTEEIYYKAEDAVKIDPSSDILSIFEDNDDDSLYAEALPYLSGDSEAQFIPAAVSHYISDVVRDDCDDLLEAVRDELNAALEKGHGDSIYMELGPYIFTASIDFSA